MIADTDFVLALVKPGDWLASNAQALLARYRGSIRSTEAALIELLWVARRRSLRTVDLVSAAHELAPFPNIAKALRAARYVEEDGLTPFDAMHAAHAKMDHEPILSSDAAFDRLGIERIPLR